MKNYSNDYLGYIEKMRGFCPSITNKKEITDLWWGNANCEKSWKIEKAVNSKKTSFQCRKDLKLGLESTTVLNNTDELNNVKIPFVLKSFFGFSGKGLIFIRDEEQRRKVGELNFPILCEPLLNRVRDFGVFYHKSSYEIVQNLIDYRGQFKGALVQDNLVEESLILKRTRPIFDWYATQFGIEQLQIDCFQYLEDGELVLNPLCEVNHRNTMGKVTVDIQHQFGGPSSTFIIVQKKNIIKFKDESERIEKLGSLNYHSKLGVLCLSPVDTQFQVYFLTEESKRTLQLLIVNWWQKIRQSATEKLPREFIIDT